MSYGNRGAEQRQLYMMGASLCEKQEVIYWDFQLYDAVRLK